MLKAVLCSGSETTFEGNFRFENFVFADLKVMDSSDIFDTASQEGEEEYEEELSAAEVSVCFILT